MLIFEITKASISIIAVISILALYYAGTKNRKLLLPLSIIGIVFSSLYIVWRAVFSLPYILSVDIIFAILLLLFEVLAFIQSLTLRMLFHKNKGISLEKDTDFKELPTVDVIVSAYNEPVEIIKRTLISCLGIEYPNKKINIYIGDDGHREEIKALAEELGVNYITREKNTHAKAGNLNNVLKTACSEFVLLLDADMIPHRKILKKMIYYFEDNSTAFVQSPQVFYNDDPYQYNLKLGQKIPNEQEFFMRVLQEKRALYNAVLHVGTNAIFRRSAIDKIGGIPTGSITEDMATGMLMQNEKYKSFYLNEVLAIGLSPDNFVDLIKQRDRWCRGTIQIYKRYSPLRMKGLGFAQKVLYLDGFFYWMFGIKKLVFVISPLLFLLFRVSLFDANFFDLIYLYIPHYVATVCYFKSVAKNKSSVFLGHIYEMALAAYMALAFIFELLFGKKIKFNVTPKGTTTQRKTFRIKLAMPNIILLLISVAAIILNIYWLITDFSNTEIIAVAINMAWCVYNLTALAI
ncbi:glycosyltransferase [bacterium]|nr:glycosyltransferase [bacterium]